MRLVLLVMAASLTGACVMEEEPLGAEFGEAVAEVGWSEVQADVDPGDAWTEAVRRAMSCQDHYAACMQTKLGARRTTPAPRVA